MTADNKIEIEKLQQSLAQTVETFRSANELLNFNKELVKDEQVLADKLTSIKKLQREFLLDSFRVNRFHKEYKAWENKDRDIFIGNEIKGYNNKLGQMSRLNFETEKLDKEYESLRETVKIPVCRLSIQTVKLYDEGKLLQYVVKNANDEYPSSVDIKELFSLDTNSNLPPPDFKVFNGLLNIEYKLRIQRKVKYEILLSVKQQLTAKNKKWSSRDSELNYFMTRKLINVMNEVEKVRKSEYEDLKDFDYENNEDEEDEEEAMREQDFEDEESINENDRNGEDDEEDDVSANENDQDDIQVDIEDDAEEANGETLPQPDITEHSTEALTNIENEADAASDSLVDTVEHTPVSNDDNEKDDEMNIDS